MRIAVNLSLSFLRKRRKHPVPLDLVDEPAAGATGPLRRNIPRARILQAVDQLRSNYRVSFVLFHIQGHSYEEVATLMGVKRNDVRNYLFRARRILRKTLATVEGGLA